VGGRGELVPLRDGSCGAAWLSAVVHHFAAIDIAARELSRVVRPEGVVLIREAFPGRMDDSSLGRYFPDAVRYIDDTYPLLDDVVGGFERAGFRYELLMSVSQRTAHNLPDALHRVRHRADTTLQSISDEAFEAGLARLRQDAAANPDQPVIDRLDLLVLRRT
jgi:SAM-dependent methyltransferase